MSYLLKRRIRKTAAWLQIILILVMPVNSVHADGLTGGVVVDGAAIISATANTTTITQSTQNAVINWDSFSIDAGQTATFVQPNVSAAVLNRVTGGSLSSIAGQLNANGQVFIANPNGVVFANGAMINVGGLTATTLDVADSQFMQGGQLDFSGTSAASVINDGSITATAGNINLFAADVQNNGTLTAPHGIVNLGAGHNVTLHENGTYTVTGANGAVQVLNTGLIDGGRAMLTAGVGSTAVNADVEKATMIVRKNGRVYLGTAASTIELAGGSMVNATAGAAPSVTLDGADTQIAATDINATAAAGGGSVAIGGTDANSVTADATSITDSTINVSATDAGDGGDIVVWSRHDTLVSGSRLSADAGVLGGNGGFIETSSHGTMDIGSNVLVTASGPLGSGGLWLIDPTDMTFDAVAAAAAELTLDSGTDVTISTASGGTDDGNIEIDPVTVSTTAGGAAGVASLNFNADNDILGSGFTFESTAGQLNVNMTAAGAVELEDFTLETLGGDVQITGTGHGETINMGPEMQVGVLLIDGTIDTTHLTPGLGGAIGITGNGNVTSDPGLAGENAGIVFSEMTIIGGGMDMDSFGAWVTNNIDITGVGGGLDSMAVTTSADLSDYDGRNVGVVIADGTTITLDHDRAGTPSTVHDPTLTIDGTGGPGQYENIGVLMLGSDPISITSVDSNLQITGTGGGIPVAVLRKVILEDSTSGTPDNSTLIDNISDALAEANIGVASFLFDELTVEAVRSDTYSPTMPFDKGGDLAIVGTGGHGDSYNSGIDLFSTEAISIHVDDGNLEISGFGGGVDPAWILEDPGNDIVDTLFERDFEATDVEDFVGVFGTDNHGVTIFSFDTVDITSDYIETNSVRDINNQVITGNFTDHDGDTYTPDLFAADKSVARDDLNLAGNRHPDARHLLISGVGGVGGPVSDDEENPMSDIGIAISSAELNVTTESADIHMIGQGGGMPDAVLTGLIENAKDTTPFAGSGRTDLGGMVGNGLAVAVDNSTLITAIADLYGGNNDGIEVIVDDALQIRTSSNAPTGGGNRTVAEVGGNIAMIGTGGLGKRINRGIELDAGDTIEVIAEIGSVRIDGTGGGPSTAVFAIDRPGNGRSDKLFEIDLSDADVAQVVDEIFAPSVDNEGVYTFSGQATAIRSDFAEPPALRQFGDGKFGYGYFNPDDPTDRGTLVMVAGEDDGSHLIVDESGALQTVLNNSPFTINDNGVAGADIGTDGVAVVQTRTVDITGRAGTGTESNEGVLLESDSRIEVTSLAASIRIAGFGGGMDSAVTRSLIENAADLASVAGTDRIDDLSGAGGTVASAITDPVATSVIIDAMRDLYQRDNDGIYLNSDGTTLISTTLTPTAIWPNSGVAGADVLQPLGPDGSELVDLTSWGLGTMRLDMLPTVDISGLTPEEQEAVRAEIAKVSDNLIVTATRNRADIDLHGIGGAGDEDARGIHIIADRNIRVLALNTADTSQDGGNISLYGVGGGIPSGELLQPTNVIHIDNNGITDTLLEVDLSAADLPRLAADVYGEDSDGIYTQSEQRTVIQSDFIEPFVPTAPAGADWGGPVHQNGADLLVAGRDIEVVGVGGVGIDENKGVNHNAGTGLFYSSDNANIRIAGTSGGMPSIIGQHLIVNAAAAGIANVPVINAISDLYGDENMGVELAGRLVSIVSNGASISAPNSQVSAISVIGTGGNGSYANIGVDIHGNRQIEILSGVGNVAVVGSGGGFPSAVITDTSAAIDSINELPGLSPSQVAMLRPGNSSGDIYGAANHGIHTRSQSTEIGSRYDEPDIGDPADGLNGVHVYGYRNGAEKRNPFFLGAGVVAQGTPKTDSTEGFVRVNRLDIPEIMAGQSGAGSNGRVEGREVVVAGYGGIGQDDNKGVFLQGGDSHIVSLDADVDVDGLGGGIPDEVIAALNASHPGAVFDTRISNLYGVNNHGVQIIGSDSGIQIDDEGRMEVNGTGGQGFASNKGILIRGANLYEAEEGDIVMVGTGGGILETFNREYDAAANPGTREENHGIHVELGSTIRSNFEAASSDDPYEMKTGGLLVLDGQVGNNQGLGNDEVGELRDIADASYDHDLGAVSLDGSPRATAIIDDAGLLISASRVISADADIDVFANLDLLIRSESTVETNGYGDVAAVATRIIEVSGGSFIGTGGLKSNGDPTLTTVAWDQASEAGDHLGDKLGRLKVDSVSSIGGGDGAQLRLYGNRRGPNPQPFGTNIVEPHPTDFLAGTPAYSNEIATGASFAAVPWTNVEQNNPGPNDPLLPVVNSGDHNLEFCTWEQEQWGVSFDLANRRSVSDSDRFSMTQAPSAYNFGNPDGVLGYNDEYVFYYPGPDLHAPDHFPVDMCPTLPFSCYLREHIGPMSYEQAMASVFPWMGSSFTYSGDWNGGTSSAFDTNDVSAFLQTPITVVGPDRTSLTVQGVNELITFFEIATPGAYTVSGNSHEQPTDAANQDDSSFHATYEHDSSDPTWREKLMHILSEGLVVPEPLTASLDGSN